MDIFVIFTGMFLSVNWFLKVGKAIKVNCLCYEFWKFYMISVFLSPDDVFSLL